MKFSERMGLVTVRPLLQNDAMDDNLRTSLWNVLHQAMWGIPEFKYSRGLCNGRGMEEFTSELWIYHFKDPVDDMPENLQKRLAVIRKYFFECEWYEVYELLEFVIAFAMHWGPHDLEKCLRILVKDVLEIELSGFRLIEGKFIQVTEENEIMAVSQAVTSSPFDGAKAHLQQALEHFSNRESPDFRNSIKESISAVESAAKEITGDDKATLGQALKELEKIGVIHPALKSSFSSLYGYTSDADGIRHAMLEESNLTLADAKYFLVSCSAFVNLLAEKFALANGELE